MNKPVDPKHIDEIVATLRRSGETSEEDLKSLQTSASCADAASLPDAIAAERSDTGNVNALQKEDNDSVDIRRMLSEMKLPDKIKAALLGNSTCRAMLISDPNRMIQQCVLKNPKMTEKEIEEFSRNPNMPQAVLRSIADTKEWMKNYSIKCNIVLNPKTPVDQALKWLKFLNSSDLKKVSKSKNLSSVVSTAATKKVAETEKK